jgi:hypothetical protein
MLFLYQIPLDSEITPVQLRDKLQGQYNLDQVRSGLNKLLKAGKLYLHYEHGQQYYSRKI